MGSGSRGKSGGLMAKLIGALREFPTREYSFNMLMAGIIGIIGGYGAVGFRWAIAIVEKITFHVKTPTFDILLQMPWYWRLAIPVIGGLIVGPIVTFFSSEAKGHGVPEVMAAVATKGGIIRGRVAAAKVIASAVTIGTGGSAGSEGPIVQIGSSIASALGQLFRVSPRRMKTFVGCGAAAGIAATFNAPVAGMLFSLEIVMGDFAVSQLSPIIVASVLATAVSRMHLGNAPAFSVPGYEMVSPLELISYAVLGVAAAFVAVGFSKTLTATEDFFENLRIPDWTKPAVGGLVIGVMGAFGLPHVYGVGYEFIEEALAGHLALTLMLILIVAKIVATSATLGSGGSGGILAPSLFMGAMIGGIIWNGTHAIAPEYVATTYGPYALVGMAAVVAAATHAPLQAILILFELTGGYEVILPLMLASIIAVIVSRKLFEESIYTVKLSAKGIKLRRGAEVNVLKGIHTREVMRTDFKVVQDNTRLRPVLDLIADSSTNSSIFVTNRDDHLVGYIAYNELRHVLFDVEALEPVLAAADIANLSPVSVRPDDTLDVVIQLFARRNLDELPVIDPDSPGRIIGSVHRADVVDSYNHELLKRDLMGTVASSVLVAQKVRSTPLAENYVMAEIEMPSAWSGKDLRTLDLRGKESIEVMLVSRYSPDKPSNTQSLVASPDLVLRNGDTLLVSGPKEVIERLARR
ncbi:MAG: chloride channel protein [bacterium]